MEKILTFKDTLFGLAMQAMCTAPRAVFVEFDTAGVVPPILVRVVVALVTLSAFQCNEHAVTFFSHGLCVLLQLGGESREQT